MVLTPSRLDLLRKIREFGCHSTSSPQQFKLGDHWLVALAGHLSDEREPPRWFWGRAKLVQEVLEVGTESVGVDQLSEKSALGAKYR